MLKNLATGLITLSLLGLTACGGEDGNGGGAANDTGAGSSNDANAGGGDAGGGDALSGEAALTALRDHVTELEARTEHDAARVKVQHVLISFAGRGVQGVTRGQEEAEQLAAEVYQKALAGEDFAALMKEFSDDTGGGTYAMNTGPAPAGEFQRTGMVPAFGNTGWRLEVGQIGVAQFDPRASRYGWHIVKRVE